MGSVCEWWALGENCGDVSGLQPFTSHSRALIASIAAAGPSLSCVLGSFICIALRSIAIGFEAVSHVEVMF